MEPYLNAKQKRHLLCILDKSYMFYGRQSNLTVELRRTQQINKK